MQIVFKICPAADWAAADRTGRYDGSPVDHRDGFIHLSGESQLRETARRHFAGQAGLVLVAFAAEGLAGLKWEPSRGGDLFPHVYGSLPTSTTLWVKDLPLVDGAHQFPADIPA